MKWFWTLCLLISACPVWAQERLALVIGNNDYDSVIDLQKAVADAEAVSAKLQTLGFETIEGLNLDRRGMNQHIADFTARLDAGDTAFVFFAGHGVEIDGENYLLPTDILTPSTGETDFVKSESIALSNLLDRVRATGARTSIAIIDACRDNPFETHAGRSIGRTRGLGRINAPQGMFVIFSAGAGQMALDRLSDDEAEPNSVFTRALLPRLSEPGLELRSMVADLRRDVRDLSRTVQHTQIPAYYDEMLGEFYFSPAVTQDQAAEDLPVQAMRADLELARSVGTVSALDTFLEKYHEQSENYTYEVALQLRDALALSNPPAPEDDPAPQHAVSAPTPAPLVPDSREVMRATQQALNAIGCNVGVADGLAGPRTRRAFAEYRDVSGSTLGADDLGTRHALEEVQSASGTICQVSAPAPAPTTGFSMAGMWQFKATCALVLNVTGSVRYTSAGGNKYFGQLKDSLGQTANTEIFVNEQQISGTDYFPAITVKWRGRLAADGQSFTASGSTGCSVYAWRA
ncbi:MULTISPECIES: caspase family protein [unclassified Ruegeria]|uniref:caspase family protein n=1 Tax=unclassified Ruegeria TaxID=2625375 RepID=UPI0014891444|nr:MULTISPECIES: caspase family protein [unclassified Ruegeria]